MGYLIATLIATILPFGAYLFKQILELRHKMCALEANLIKSEKTSDMMLLIAYEKKVRLMLEEEHINTSCIREFVGMQSLVRNNGISLGEELTILETRVNNRIRGN